jgi:hypothetical protein
LVRLFDPVIAPLSRAHLLVIHPCQLRKPADRCCVTAQLVRVDPFRRGTRATEQLVE